MYDYFKELNSLVSPPTTRRDICDAFFNHQSGLLLSGLLVVRAFGRQVIQGGGSVPSSGGRMQKIWAKIVQTSFLN